MPVAGLGLSLSLSLYCRPAISPPFSDRLSPLSVSMPVCNIHPALYTGLTDLLRRVRLMEQGRHPHMHLHQGYEKGVLLVPSLATLAGDPTKAPCFLACLLQTLYDSPLQAGLSPLPLLQRSCRVGMRVGTSSVSPV